jgi:hypothetical protein
VYVLIIISTYKFVYINRHIYVDMQIVPKEKKFKSLQLLPGLLFVSPGSWVSLLSPQLLASNSPVLVRRSLRRKRHRFTDFYRETVK